MNLHLALAYNNRLGKEKVVYRHTLVLSVMIGYPPNNIRTELGIPIVSRPTRARPLRKSIIRGFRATTKAPIGEDYAASYYNDISKV